MTRHPSPYSTEALLAFIALTMLLSIGGGYALSRFTAGMSDASLQRTGQLLSVEDGLDDAAIGLGQQIQEWKDMLLRAQDAEMYDKHRQGFIDASVGVQEALLRTRTAMKIAGMDTRAIEQLATEHKTLLSNYVRAHTRLALQKKASPYDVDKEVMGVDRHLQQHLAAVRSEAELLARQQFSETKSQQRRRSMLVAVAGTASLLCMALLGFAVARRFAAPVA